MKITEPVVVKQANGLDFGWLEGTEEWLNVKVTNIRRGFNDIITAKITVYVLLGERNILENIRINLESLRDRQDLASHMYRLYNLVDLNIYQALVEQICVRTLQTISAIEPAIPLCEIPTPETPQFRLEPVLLEGEANMIYGDGGVGKSTLACATAVAIRDNIALPPGLVPLIGNVLYLDYEQRGFDIKEQCRMIREGLELVVPTKREQGDILYLYLYQRLIDCIDQVREQVLENNIQLLIIDSVGLACGGEGDDVKAVVPYFQALRSLNITTLSIDHISKSSDGRTPVGSIYKRNIPRNVFHLKSEQTPGEGTLNLGLIHMKGNKGLIKPIGLQFKFIHGNDNHVIDQIIMDSFNLSDSETLAQTLTAKDRIAGELKQGPLSVKDLVELLPDIPESTIRGTLNRYKPNAYIKLDNNKWGLPAYG